MKYTTALCLHMLSKFDEFIKLTGLVRGISTQVKGTSYTGVSQILEQCLPNHVCALNTGTDVKETGRKPALEKWVGLNQWFSTGGSRSKSGSQALCFLQTRVCFMR